MLSIIQEIFHLYELNLLVLCFISQNKLKYNNRKRKEI